MPATAATNTFRAGPDEDGHFGSFGGRYVAETLMPLILDVEAAWSQARSDPDFWSELRSYHVQYIGRPSPLYLASRLTEHFGGARLYFKRDELNHTGAHKINNVMGQALLARRMGKTRIIAETGAGQHGVATATACALFDMECEVFMGAEDVERALERLAVESHGQEIGLSVPPDIYISLSHNNSPRFIASVR